MANEKERKKPHSLSLSEREKLILSGVEKVVGATDTQILVKTSQGGLQIDGSGLKIEKFNVDDGSFSLSGAVRTLRYGEKKGFWSKLFR